MQPRPLSEFHFAQPRFFPGNCSDDSVMPVTSAPVISAR
jgi:hypothetical protein